MEYYTQVLALLGIAIYLLILKKLKDDYKIRVAKRNGELEK